MSYNYATLSAAELDELNALQNKLCKGGKKIILLAVNG